MKRNEMKRSHERFISPNVQKRPKTSMNVQKRKMCASGIVILFYLFISLFMNKILIKKDVN
jgi:hypothetical protein